MGAWGSMGTLWCFQRGGHGWALGQAPQGGTDSLAGLEGMGQASALEEPNCHVSDPRAWLLGQG